MVLGLGVGVSGFRVWGLGFGSLGDSRAFRD